MDIKTLSAMIRPVSAETTLNIYSHITDTMQQQAAARIDREIAWDDTPIPEPIATDGISDNEADNQPTEPKFEPYKGKIRKPGTGCVTMLNDHLYEGRFSPRVNGKRIAKNIYATTREEVRGKAQGADCGDEKGDCGNQGGREGNKIQPCLKYGSVLPPL